MTVDSRVDNLTHWGNMHPFFFVLHRFWGFCSAWYEERGVGGVGGGLLACSWEGKERKGRENVPPPLVSFIMVGGRGFAGWWYVTGLSAVLYHMSGLAMDV